MELKTAICILILMISLDLTNGYKSPHLQEFRNKAEQYLKTGKLKTNWQPDGAVAQLKGPLSLILKYKFKAPVEKEFNLTNIFPDCRSIKQNVESASDGVYTIQVHGDDTKKAYCDMTTDGGGWTVFQRRKDGSVNFYRKWKEYSKGFGSAKGEYWLGNSALHTMTKNGKCELRIDMINWQGTKGYAKYDKFTIADEKNSFRLQIGKYTGTADKAAEYLTTGKLKANWQPDGAVAQLKGPLSLILKYKFKAPFEKEFNLTNIFPDCRSIKETLESASDGVYTIQVHGDETKKAYCDMTTDGGGWTVFQRRKDGSVNFYRKWEEYSKGFGSAKGEYWLGNSALHTMTKNGKCELRIDMMNWQGTKGYAKYDNFKIGDEKNSFRLQIGKYTGTAGADSLKYHNNMKFSTRDADNDEHTKMNCAAKHAKGAWWFKNCDLCGLNGFYNITNSDKGIEWDGFPNGKFMKSTKMMFRCK